MSLIKSVSKGIVGVISRMPSIRTPAMQSASDVHLPMIKKIGPELYRFKNVLATMKKDDFKIAGLIVNDEAQAALGEFYLALALRLHPERIDMAGDDNLALLRVAWDTAEHDFEPWLKDMQDFVSDYNADVHDELQMIRFRLEKGEFCEGTYWTKFFEQVAPQPFEAIKEMALNRESELTSHDLVDNFLQEEKLKPYMERTRVLTADSVLMPFKKDGRDLLADNGLLLLSNELKNAMEAQKAQLQAK